MRDKSLDSTFALLLFVIILFIVMMATGCGEARREGSVLSSKSKAIQHAAYHPDDSLEIQQEQDYTPPGGISPAMAASVAEFQSDAAQYGSSSDFSQLKAITYQPDLTVNEGPVLGYATVYDEPDGSKQSAIVLNSSLLAAPADIQKRILWHEMGHALLGVDHTERDPTLVDQIMFWCTDVGANYDDSLWDSQLDWMFTQQYQEIYQ